MNYPKLYWCACLIGVVISGVQLTRSADETRTLYGELEAVQALSDEATAEYTRLLLERSALASFQNVERIALKDLDMIFPNQVESVTQ